MKKDNYKAIKKIIKQQDKAQKKFAKDSSKVAKTIIANDIKKDNAQE